MPNSFFQEVLSLGREKLLSWSLQNHFDSYNPLWISENFLCVQLADATTYVQLISPSSIVAFQYSINMFLKQTNYLLDESSYLIILDKKK